jgi:ribonuclease HI
MSKRYLLERFALFTDVSMNPQQRLGVGACLLLPQRSLDVPLHELDPEQLSGQLFYRRFTDTSSTRLEMQTVLWGLEIYRAQVPEPERGALHLYTDSQSVTGLPGRRTRLDGSAFLSGRTGKPLANASLYGEFYSASDELGFEIVKVKGHSRTSSHDNIQRIFSIVDRGARRALKLWMAEKAGAFEI